MVRRPAWANFDMAKEPIGVQTTQPDPAFFPNMHLPYGRRCRRAIAKVMNFGHG